MSSTVMSSTALYIQAITRGLGAGELSWCEDTSLKTTLSQSQFISGNNKTFWRFIKLLTMPRKKNSPGPILEPLEPEPAPPEPTPPDLAPPEPGTYQYQSQDKYGYESQDDGYGESSGSLEDFSSMSAECPEPPSSSVKPYRFTVTDTRQHREELTAPDKDAENVREFHHYHHAILGPDGASGTTNVIKH